MVGFSFNVRADVMSNDSWCFKVRVGVMSNESWCSDSSKATAKTIDLCNHPATKENKLTMAKRIIDGSLFEESWVELDEEVKAAEASGG